MRFQCVQVLLLVFVVARIEGLTGADGALKQKSMLKKPSNLAVVKKLSGKNLCIGKIQIPVGQKVDITKLKTASGKTVDLSKWARTPRSSQRNKCQMCNRSSKSTRKMD
ncbi:hypothetical protein PPTG_12535 [Phytophthora nicotianae INRA-310]|uniref:RxLR effector protein n=1 Tax=Phytophthora nicotianae (strain INRA-310) TaxID=761204 RepID=W2Q4E9_PHYN3|nr:hypothetical protein PPTG_12535 [Phytophthora nicotianae INRA-310]ETN08022.1 hypothetical protein PPTG_12535 [Phytophthora nicotianae INRA-310]